MLLTRILLKKRKREQGKDCDCQDRGSVKRGKEVKQMCKPCGCGQPAEENQEYECEDCGRTAEKEEECRDKPMKKKEKPC